MTRFLVLILLVFPQALSFAATPVAPPTIGPAGTSPYAPVIIAHGSGYVAAWLDDIGLTAARLDGDGRLLDGTATLLAARDYNFGYEDEPALASNGKALFAAWNCGTTSRRVCTGTLDPATMRIRVGASFPGRDPAVAWNGSSWAVAYWDYPGAGLPAVVRIAWFRQDGELASTFDLAAGQDPTLAANREGTTLVAWAGPSSVIQSRRVTEAGPEGEVVSLASPPVKGTNFHPLLGTDGDEFLAVWSQWGSDTLLFASPLDRAGRPKGAAATVDARREIESLAWTGRDYVAAAYDGAMTNLLRLTPTGVMKTAVPLAGGEGTSRYARVGFNGATTVAVWANFRASVFDEVRISHSRIEAIRIEPAAAWPPVVLSLGPAAQIQPAVASTPSRRLVAWTEAGAGAGRVLFTMFDSALHPIGPQGRSVRSSEGDQRFPAVATDGASFLVAWTEAREGAVAGTLHGLVVDASGASGEPFVLAPDVTHSPIALVHDGSSFLAVWTTHSGELAARHVSSAGSPTEAAQITYGELGFNPAIAWNGSSYLLAWEAYARNPDCRITCTLDTQIRAVALGADGRRQSGAATLFGDFSDFPAITWTGSHFALFTSWLYSGPVSARLFSPAGKPVGDPVVIAKQGNHAAVGHDGSAILLLWRDVEGRSFRLNLTPDLVLLSRPIVLSNQLARSWPASSSYDTVAVSSDASAMVYHLRTAESPEAAPALVIETPETAPRGRWRTAVR